LTLLACDILPHKGDTLAEQRQAQWIVGARLIVDTDPSYTIVRMRAEPLDTARGGHHVLLTRFEFNPIDGQGDEYALNLGLDLGDIRTRRRGVPYTIGSRPGDLRAYGTVTCLCRPLRPDSVTGTFTISQRGMGQIFGRIDATLFFTAWDDTTRHATYRLRQRLDGMR
jgi:hypothetical protein